MKIRIQRLSKLLLLHAKFPSQLRHHNILCLFHFPRQACHYIQWDVLPKPLSHFLEVTSHFSCSTVALCKLLQHGLNTDDKRLQDIVVKGEEIYNPEDGIRTRSKSAKSKTAHCRDAIKSRNVCRLCALNSLSISSTDPERWTNIPLLVKIFKLIVNELSTVVEANTSRVNTADWSQGEQ